MALTKEGSRDTPTGSVLSQVNVVMSQEYGKLNRMMYGLFHKSRNLISLHGLVSLIYQLVFTN